jgi:hypothetical protein
LPYAIIGGMKQEEFVKRTVVFGIGLLAAFISLPKLLGQNVHVTIDATGNGPKIDRNLFGQFAENLGRGLYGKCIVAYQVNRR